MQLRWLYCIPVVFPVGHVTAVCAGQNSKSFPPCRFTLSLTVSADTPQQHRASLLLHGWHFGGLAASLVDWMVIYLLLLEGPMVMAPSRVVPSSITVPLCFVSPASV